MTEQEFIPAPRGAIGVDIADGWIAIVQATRARGGPVFTVLADGPDGVSPELRRKLDALARSGTWTSGAVAVHESFLRVLAAPFPSVTKARRVFPSLLDVQLPFPLESCSCAFLGARRTDDGRVEACAVAARREDVDRALARLGAAGFDPEQVDHEGVALWTRSLAELPPAGEAWRAVVYIGHDRTSYVMGRGRALRAASGVRTGLRDYADPARRDAALRQLASRLVPWIRSQDPGSLQWVFTGPGAADAGVLDAARAALDLPAASGSVVHDRPSTFLARALAARALTAGPLACNMRAGEQEHARHSNARALGLRRSILLAAAAALAVLAINAGWLVHLTRQRDGLQQRVVEQARALAGVDRLPRGQELLTAERALQEKAPLLEPFRQALAPSLLHQLGPLLDTASSHGMTLDALSLRPQAVSCSGTASDWAHCEAIKALLDAAGWRTEIDRREAGADERVHFAIKGTR